MRQQPSWGGRWMSRLLVCGGVVIGSTRPPDSAAAPPSADIHFRLDQFGYRPGDPKVAVLAEPVVGYDAPNPYTPSPFLEVRRWNDDSVAWVGAPTRWSGGAVHSQSGDRVHWLDFTDLTGPGSYYLWDPAQSLGSGRFEIADDVYGEVLRHATRGYFYQRCGVAKLALHAGMEWTDGACHVGAQQDTDSRAVLDPTPATSRDLSGGWHDAGDYNKYINFADGPIHDLLYAYAAHPTVWGDDFDLPESGNCIPDLIDELQIELDWFLKMQNGDGSVLHKVSVTDFSGASPPSADAGPRRYAPPTASATISACGAFAHAAYVFRRVGDPALDATADVLEAAALSAWNWLELNPGAIPSRYDNQGFVNAAAEDSDYEQAANRTCAAVYLYAATGDPRFRTWVDGTYADVHLLQWTYAYPFEAEFQDCLLTYAALPSATPAVATAIRNAYRSSLSGNDHLGHWQRSDDAYRAYLNDGDHVWGNNRTKAQEGSMFRAMVEHGLDPGNDPDYAAAARGYLHYLHGVNPQAMVYLTNMQPFGAERSADTIYHAWFADGTDWDDTTTSRFGPAPGIVPGGVNPNYRPDPAYTGPPIEPPENQPILKSYRQWNTSWPENSWEVTENSITYQAAYVRLLATVAPDRPVATGPGSPGNSLRAVRRGADVELSWTPASGATSYDILRCAAATGPCSPTPHDTTATLIYLDPTPPGAHLWYRLRAVNACGTTE